VGVFEIEVAVLNGLPTEDKLRSTIIDVVRKPSSAPCDFEGEAWEKPNDALNPSYNHIIISRAW
jgi:hypothetical protein